MQALCLNGVADGIDHMNQRHTDGLLNRRGDFVHGVGRQHNGLCAHAFELLGAGCQHGTCLLPIACALQGGNGLEIDTVHQHIRTVVAAQTLVHLAVDDLVIRDGAFGAHAANQAQGFHVCRRLGGVWG